LCREALEYPVDLGFGTLHQLDGAQFVQGESICLEGGIAAVVTFSRI
jgi:hypothetical protein